MPSIKMMRLLDLADLDPATLPSEPSITAITLAGLSVVPLVARTDAMRSARQAQLQQAAAVVEPILFDSLAARAVGHIAAQLRASGRTPKTRAYDALVAAIAVSRGLPVHTANPRDNRL